jgi:hypothetical protein
MEDKKRNNLKEAMETELKELITVQGPVEAEVIKSLLSSHNIPCLMQGLVVQSVHAFSADGLGKIKILVSAHDLPDAQKLIERQPED